MPSSTNNKHNDADNEYEDNSTAIFFKQRPVRHGMWFIAHKSTADKMRDSLDLQEEPLNIWDEFFAHHPVGDAYCQNFVALQLSEETLYQNRERVRCASYRWEDVKGVGVDGKEYQAPSNYVWFFKMCWDGWILLQILVLISVEEIQWGTWDLCMQISSLLLIGWKTRCCWS